MENIKIKDILDFIEAIMLIAAFIKLIAMTKKEKIDNPNESFNQRLNKIEYITERQEKAIQTSKKERELLLSGVLACLKGLKEQGCNGPVTKSISDIEIFINKELHK